MTNRPVEIDEAVNNFASLLSDVQKGETVTFTRNGKPVAQLVPIGEHQPHKVSEAIEALKTFHKGRTLNGLTVREMIEEGRR